MASSDQAASYMGDAPLLLAAGDTNPTFVNLLLSHGADAAIEGESGVTPPRSIATSVSLIAL